MIRVINAGGSAGGATVAQGTNAAKPGTPATNFYFATDTGELFTANAGLTAWQSIAQVTGGFTAATAGADSRFANNNFGNLFIGNAGSTGFKQISAQVAVVGSSLNVNAAGSGLAVKEGANCKQGISTLVAGTVVVANTSVTASSRIFLTCNNSAGTPGFLRVSARTAGTSFTILSSSGTDTSDVAWQIFEPSV